jgi:hypothetical protein
MKLMTELERNQLISGDGFEEGETLYVKHKAMPNLPARAVTFEVKNGKNGVRVLNEWFEWDFFFEVNYL